MRRRRIAVVDTTFMRRLRDLSVLDELPLIFDEIRVPLAVRDELGAQPGKLRRWLGKLLRTQGDFVRLCDEEDPLVRDYLEADLDRGEAAAIAQAGAVGAAVIVDEKKGRQRAATMSIEVVPTVAVLVRLKDSGAIPAIRPLLDRLVALGFHLSARERDKALEEAGEK